MQTPQLHKTFRAIRGHPHTSLAWGLAKHAQWHLRRLVGAFPYEQRISQSRIVARDGQCGVSALVNNQGMYDWNNMNLLKRLLRDGGTFLDVGANIGSYTLIASEQSEAAVHAFEPHPATHDYLRANVLLNKRQNVTTHCVAAGDRDGVLSFTNIPGSSTNSVRAETSDTIQVPAIRLETFCRQHGVRPEYLKIDVEGFEYEVLEGLGAELSSVKVALIEISDHAATVRELLDRHDLQGPYAYDADSGTFSPRHTRGREDPIFVSRLAQPGLLSQGFLFL